MALFGGIILLDNVVKSILDVYKDSCFLTKESFCMLETLVDSF